ncbi:MAG: type II toxin-antitoxin system RelB/DinJ family antitoxin [Lachnospiraceae bacterium]|nr:type II toxin-antitoxin system RelB/DinJ family antitoxin [Lachnospiraceae bacterium]
MAVATSNTKINFTMKMDKSTRDEFHQLCDTIGISMSAAINALMKQAIRQQGMAFSALDENGFLPAEASELKRRRIDLESGHYESHELIEV